MSVYGRAAVLEALYSSYEMLPEFDTLKTRSRLVKGYGCVKQPPIMFIGEAPGELEDMTGQPFVGKSGAKFAEFLNEIGLKRKDVFTTNILKYRPPRNRDPLVEEITASFDFLLREIEIVEPYIVAPLGRFSAKALLPTESASITQLNGRILYSPYLDIPVVPIVHPGAILRPGGIVNSILIREGFQILRELMNESGIGTSGPGDT